MNLTNSVGIEPQDTEVMEKCRQGDVLYPILFTSEVSSDSALHFNFGLCDLRTTIPQNCVSLAKFSSGTEFFDR